MTGLSINKPTLRVLDIIAGTSVDGPGLRTSVYLAGCNHECPGCHNPQSWDLTGGREMTVDEIVGIIEAEEYPVTLTGGDPLCQPEGTAALARAIKERLGYDIWLYTGYTIEEIEADERLYNTIGHVDTIVDGPFVLSERDLSLCFRGSRNQRIIKLNERRHQPQ